jgi:hypothetical protein
MNTPSRPTKRFISNRWTRYLVPLLLLTLLLGLLLVIVFTVLAALGFV